MPTFLLILLGQSISMLGSQLAGFAIGLWIYQRTGSATLYGLSALATVGPYMLAAPFAGAVVDRWNHKRALLVSSVGAGVCSLLLAALLVLESPPLGAILAALSVAAMFNALEFPAFSAVTTALVPGARLGQANGYVQLGLAIGQIAAPFAAVSLLPVIGLQGIVLLDVASFAFAIVTLAAVRVPASPAKPAIVDTGFRALLADVTHGFRYLREQPGLRSLLLFFIMTNFNIGILQVLFTPLILSFSDAKSLGSLVSIGGLGMLAGSGLMAAWGGPRRRLYGILWLSLFQGMLLLLVSSRPSLLFAGMGCFGVLFATPLIAGCSQTIWQRRVPLDEQGRVFAVRAMVARAALPVAYLVAGPLAQHVFEPLLSPDGLLAPSAGKLLGVGPGRGIALLFMLLGALTVVASVRGSTRRDLLALDD